MWCAISSARIVGPWFFEENGVTVTVNSERYVSMLEQYFFPEIEELNLGDIWYQQDGATAHTSRVSMSVLRERFPERLISIRGDLEWPFTRFVPLRFFLWGYLKARVYVNRPQSLDDLKDNIRQEIANIPGDMLVRVIENTRNRYMKCIDNEGGHLPDMIFKTV